MYKRQGLRKGIVEFICQTKLMESKMNRNIIPVSYTHLLSLCANGLRIINKKGLDAALTEAVAKGYCDWKSIKVIG